MSRQKLRTLFSVLGGVVLGVMISQLDFSTEVGATTGLELADTRTEGSTDQTEQVTSLAPDDEQVSSGSKVEVLGIQGEVTPQKIATLKTKFQKAGKTKPNFLVIFGDDIGWSNFSCYHQGMMGGRTPNIDRVAREGARFTDYYAQQSCTAGRAALITGQHPFRVGLLKVGMPGAKQGLQPSDPTIADLLKPHGYSTAQIGKNHLGDRNEFLPTMHGFDEFYGNLYHLNAEEEPEDPQYPRDKVLPNGKTFFEQFGPRGVLHCKSSDVDDQTVDPRFGKVGKQTIEDTGPLTRERMRTVEKDLLKHSLDFIDRSHEADKPFFLWHNLTRMHVFTHLSEEWKNKSGYGLYADGMAEFDWVVGQLLGKLDDLGIAENTVVIVTTDNGAEVMTWPDGGCTPFHGEKGTTWEGGLRVPCVVRWPGVIEPGSVINDVMSHEDWCPTLLAAAGDPNVKEKLLKGHEANGKTFRNHLDGYNFMPFFKGDEKEGPRHEIFYFDDNANLNAVRVNDWKIHFQVQEGNLQDSILRPVNMPYVINLRSDPYERFMRESNMYFRWYADKMWTFVPAQTVVSKFVSTFEEYPPSQASGTFGPGAALKKLSSPGRGN